MKRYRRNEEKGISDSEISKDLSDYQTLTPEESFLQKAGLEIIKPKSAKGIIQIIFESFYPKQMPLFHRN